MHSYQEGHSSKKKKWYHILEDEVENMPWLRKALMRSKRKDKNPERFTVEESREKRMAVFFLQ